MKYNRKIILKILSIILALEGFTMLIPALAAVITGDKNTAVIFAFTGIILFLLFGLIFITHRNVKLKLKPRDVFLLGAFIWGAVCLTGALPFLLSPYGYTFAEAFFESAAGWTTTGAWSFDPAASCYSLILWKAMCSWLGGIGVILMIISLFPGLGVKGLKNAKQFYMVYILFTIAEFVLLSFSGMPVKETIVNTLFSISTSGILNFSGLGVIEMTPYVQTVFTVFTFLSSCNFAAFFVRSFAYWKKSFRSTELKVYVSLLAAAILIIAFSLLASGIYEGFCEALGMSVTQAVSFSSTSGFKVAETNMWPATAKFILLILVFIGGCSDSTSGSVKVMRFIIFFKLIRRGIFKRIHPKAVKPVMLEGEPVSAKDASETTGFLLIFFMLFIFGAIVFSLENLDLETCFSLSFGTLTNNGTAFGMISNGDYTFLSGLSKIFSGFLMICGKLEIWPVMILFSRSFWNTERS